MGYKTLIHGTIITMNDDSPFYHDGMIIIKDSTIESIQSSDVSKAKGDIINVNGKILLPGFINTHTHTHSPLFRGIADDLYLMNWLKKYMWPAEAFMKEQDAYNAAKLSCLELTESGVTTYADQFYYSEAVTQAAKESGLRAFIAPSVFSRPSPETDDPLSAAQAFIENHINDKDSLIYPCIGPHAIYSCNTETLKKVRDIAKEHDIIVHIHISETMVENQDSFKEHDLSPTAYLEKIGLLDCKVLSAHNIHLDDHDLELYKKYDVKVSYNPISNLKLVSGIMPYKKLKNKDLDISLAMDGVQSNNAFDLLADLKTGILMQKMHENDPTLLNAYEALKLITINAAKCLYFDHEVGSLEPHKKADITMIDTHRANMTPLHLDKFEMVVSAIAYSASSADVSDVMVNGEFIYRNRQHLRLNRENVKMACQTSSRRILEQIDYFKT